jgi:ubiquitin-conjugating enzyme E2 Q
MTGHITSGGSICMEILTNQGWSAGLNIIKVLIVLKLEMIAGGARLDPKNHRTVYSMSEAKNAYKRMLQSHGWK